MEESKKSYHVHLNQFEGPLDLLLHLIESAEVDIKDIFISEITTQYLQYMAQIEGLDMDMASEFINMAATLLYIKSRQLLPRPPKEEIEEEDPEVLLIRQLREYQVFKKAGEELAKLEGLAKGEYTRLPEEMALPDQEITLSGATLQELYRAFFTVLHAQPEEQPSHPLHHVRPDAFTVRIQIAKIRNLLLEKRDMDFLELFAPLPARMEIIVTFMALMEMIARGEIEIRQSAPFTPIMLHACGNLGNDDSDIEYMDEYAE
ncbi:MAG: segregation/condensation protein A [Clostridiales bacterium]|jgi:segregation and condensation protein A|nr:segregation/condensation protein A [Clostridiales bacterium]